MTRDMLYLQCCPTDTRQREEVSVINTLITFIVTVAAGGEVYMENLAVSFLVTFMASIAAYYVCKWLDGDK